MPDRTGRQPAKARPASKAKPRTPAKTPAKKARARKATAPRARTSTAPGKRGPAPLVLRGFTYHPPTKDDEAGTATWAPKSPGAELLAALSVGATWEHAAHYAHLHEATGRQWNSRGEAALGEHPDLDHLTATDPDPETVAYAAFHVAAREARVSPVIGALDGIDRARKKGDWRAGAQLLKVLPQARPYTEVTRQELTGADDGPIIVEAGDATVQAILDLTDRIAHESKEPTP